MIPSRFGAHFFGAVYFDAPYFNAVYVQCVGTFIHIYLVAGYFGTKRDRRVAGKMTAARKHQRQNDALKITDAKIF